MRWMAIDHGSRRIGIALCDADETVATPYGVWPNTKQMTVERLANLAMEEGVGGVVIGLPRHEDGQESATAPQVREFAAALDRALSGSVPILFWGEHLSTVEAERLMVESGARSSDIRKLADAVAASLILEDLLASRRRDRIPLTSPDGGRGAEEAK